MKDLTISGVGNISIRTPNVSIPICSFDLIGITDGSIANNQINTLTVNTSISNTVVESKYLQIRFYNRNRWCIRNTNEKCVNFW